jgi:hypothetical protein
MRTRTKLIATAASLTMAVAMLVFATFAAFTTATYNLGGVIVVSGKQAVLEVTAKEGSETAQTLFTEAAVGDTNPTAITLNDLKIVGKTAESGTTYYGADDDQVVDDIVITITVKGYNSDKFVVTSAALTGLSTTYYATGTASYITGSASTELYAGSGTSVVITITLTAADELLPTTALNYSIALVLTAV